MDALYNKQAHLNTLTNQAIPCYILSQKLKQKKITATEQHFSKIKSILKEEQILQLETFKKKALKLILKRRPSAPSARLFRKK